jgi:pSer/pThr/pTyr-binding forkhead associated (FHA) protein
LKLDALLVEARGLDLAAFRARHPEPALIFPTTPGDGRPSPVVFFLAKTERNSLGDQVTIGRAENNDVCLPLSSVSKLHASFLGSRAGWSLRDGHATNGTFVADKRLAAGAEVTLRDGVTVGFGPETIATFYLTEGLFELLRRLG